MAVPTQKSGRVYASMAFRIALLLCVPTAISATRANAEVSLRTGDGNYSLQVRSYRDIPFRTTIRQQYDYSCGSAALATLLRFHYGRNVGESEIFTAMYKAGDQASIQKVGFSLLDMKQYLERSGFKADGYRMSLEELAKNGTAAITLISVGRYKHFVVIKGIRTGKVLIGDPALGLKTYTLADFEKMWSGIIFMIHDSPSQTVAFNRDEEWNPWAQAPSHERLDARSLFGMNAGLPPIYQVMQLTPIAPISR
jgi:predicted double-glycine peptidase